MGAWFDPVMTETIPAPRVRPFPWLTVLAVVTGVTVVITALSYLHVGPLGGSDLTGTIHQLFDVAKEESVATAWSALLMSAAAVLSATCARLAWSRDLGAGIAWLVLAAGFAALAIDEVAGVHERLPQYFDLSAVESSLGYAWLMIGIPLALAIIAVVWWCARRLTRTTRWLLLTGIVVFFAGAVGVEALTGFLAANHPDTHNAWLGELIHLEEFLELAGIGIAACAPLGALELRARKKRPDEVSLALRLPSRETARKAPRETPDDAPAERPAGAPG